jgi:hypothetical protein
VSSGFRITCKEAHRLLSERLDRPLAGRENWRLWLHLRFCEMCSRFARHLDVLRAAVRRLGQ